MDFEALQAARESCRVYSDRPVPREALAHLVDVARLAPSGCNAQPWRFIIIDEPEARAKLIEALDDDGLTGCPWGDRVPNFILICEDEAHVKPGVAGTTVPSTSPRWTSAWLPWPCAMRPLPWGWAPASSAP